MIIVVIDDDQQPVEILTEVLSAIDPNVKVLSFIEGEDFLGALDRNEIPLNEIAAILLDHDQLNKEHLDGAGIYKALDERGLESVVYGISRDNPQTYIIDEMKRLTKDVFGDPATIMALYNSWKNPPNPPVR